MNSKESLNVTSVSKVDESKKYLVLNGNGTGIRIFDLEYFRP